MHRKEKSWVPHFRLWRLALELLLLELLCGFEGPVSLVPTARTESRSRGTVQQQDRQFPIWKGSLTSNSTAVLGKWGRGRVLPSALPLLWHSLWPHLIPSLHCFPSTLILCMLFMRSMHSLPPGQSLTECSCSALTYIRSEPQKPPWYKNATFCHRTNSRYSPLGVKMVSHQLVTLIRWHMFWNFCRRRFSTNEIRDVHIVHWKTLIWVPL